MKKKLVVLSVDSLFDEDMEFLKTLPNFKKILDQGCYAEGGMRSLSFFHISRPCIHYHGNLAGVPWNLP